MLFYSVFAVLVIGCHAAIRKDIVSKVPGYGDHFQPNVYSGFLETSSPGRQLHYVFVESSSGANSSHPVTLWLNGGPGCSSLLGFLQQIGPFYLEEGTNYTKNDSLTENPYSWHKLSHLLFIESPAGVGYSFNHEKQFKYTDVTTREDNFAALKFFFANYPEYRNNSFWIAGESYAGKYIPDLAQIIDRWNMDSSTEPSQKINMKGVFIGNGVIDFRDKSLQHSSVEYMINHDFIDPEILSYWENSCKNDPDSAGCLYFEHQFAENTDEVNPYNIYSYCYYNDSFAVDGKGQKKQFLSQESIIMNLAKENPVEQASTNDREGERPSRFNGAPCSYFDGLYQYFNVNAQTFHNLAGMKWNGPCAENITEKYHKEMWGSLLQMEYLIEKTKNDENFQLVLYNGDWDSVVPYLDTIKNLDKLSLQEADIYKPIFTHEDQQHIGFSQIYGGVVLILVKGASHQVPQSKRQAAYQIYEALVGGNKEYFGITSPKASAQQEDL